jgi:hypothetical protein
MDLIPTTAAEVERSILFELARRTETGLCLYVRPLKREIADQIMAGSRDFKFLCGEGDNQYLLVPIREGRILRGEPKPNGDFEKSEVIEVLSLLSQRMRICTPDA